MNSGLNLIHLKFFCDAVKYESISEAAKMNYISQSAVSQAITKLETIFGVQLIFHNRQKLQVTDEGKVVVEQAKAIFRTVQSTFEQVNQTKEEVTGTLRFVTTKSLGMSFLAPVYQLLKSKYPLLDFKFRMGGLNLIRTALKNEEAEFAIVVYDHNFDQFAKHPLKKGRLHLYHAKEASPDQIDHGVFIDDYEGMHISELTEFLHKQGYQQPIQDAVAGWELTARFTQMGMGVGFFPDYILANQRLPNIKHHPLKTPDFEYEICAIYNKGVKLSKNAELFLNHFTLE